MPENIWGTLKPPIKSIKTHTSLNQEIINEQYETLSYQDKALPDSFESEFKSKFYGAYNPFYNCHGLTFACKRTGIYDDNEIRKIIKAEYMEVKSTKDVVVGDIILYSLDQNEDVISHSGIVVEVIQGISPVIKIYSKVRMGREIVHQYDVGPYKNNYKKFYRISYGNRIKYT
jgi:hypothetical protein